MEEDWDTQANYLGYSDKREMLVDLYTRQRLSLSEIARRLGRGIGTVGRHLQQEDIKRRSQGGANVAARKQYWLHLMDQRLVFSEGLAKLAGMIGCNPSYIYKYKRKVKGAPIDALRTNLSDEGITPIFGGS